MDRTAPVELHPALADALATERDALNARFALRVRSGAKIDALAFRNHLSGTLNSLIASVHAILPERVRFTAVTLYDVSLDLFAASLLGPEAKLPFVEQLWREVLPATARLLAREPQRVAGSLNNAVFQIAAQTGTRPGDWLARMAELAPACDSVDQLLDVGKILAWQAGMVQYRSAALQTCGKLPLELALKTLRQPSGPPQQLAALLNRLGLDPWFDLHANGPATGAWALKVVAQVGAFRGFGGPFLRPPTVRCQNKHWFVSDGITEWQMLADSFGTLFQRIGNATATAKEKRLKADNSASIDRKGNVCWGDMSAQFGQFANCTSFACDDTTLGATLASSHHVFLITRIGSGS